MQRENFFNRVISFTPPQDPLEGAVKMFVLASLALMPITLMMDMSDIKSVESTIALMSKLLPFALIAAPMIGAAWGAINNYQANEEAPRPHQG